MDDDVTIRKVIKLLLTREGFHVTAIEDGRNILEMINVYKPDLIILDILLPFIDGIEICRLIRAESDIPVIFLSSKGDPEDIVLGLGIGGDDYIVKPFNSKELIARIKASLRRNQRQQNSTNPANGNFPQQKQILIYPGLEIDLPSHTVLAHGTPVTLTKKEFELLVLLAQNPNRVFTYQQLLELIWQYKYDSDYRTVMVHINRLRNKIELDPSKPKFIITVRGVGYKFSYE
ncbi:MAG: winged helix-turn-helix domain-containing protein [Bacillota bacterium]